MLSSWTSQLFLYGCFETICKNNFCKDFTFPPFFLITLVSSLRIFSLHSANKCTSWMKSDSLQWSLQCKQDCGNAYNSSCQADILHSVQPWHCTSLCFSPVFFSPKVKCAQSIWNVYLFNCSTYSACLFI